MIDFQVIDQWAAEMIAADRAGFICDSSKD